MFLGGGDAAIQPTTAGKKTGITKKLMAGRAMESHWPTGWVQASILEPGRERAQACLPRLL